jgi:glutathione synthase/RimK-type ligase-like ATP-grasp enzyme
MRCIFFVSLLKEKGSVYRLGRIPVLIIAPEDDLHAHTVSSVLRRNHVGVQWIDLGSLNMDVRLTLLLDRSVSSYLVTGTGRSIMLADVNTIWWRRPRLPEELADRDAVTSEFVHNEWEHFLDGIEPFSNVRWVNPPEANHRAQRKAVQLNAAHVEGLRVPHTVITNDPNAVRALAAKGIPLIYKRLGTVCRPTTVTRPLLPEDLKRLDALPNCPAIFQEQIEAKLDIRVTIIGSELYAAEIDSQSGDAPLDWRLDYTVPFRPHTLDNETACQLRALMRKLNLVYGAVDLRLTPEGEYVFLEINPSGQYLFIELLANIPLTERMAAFLASSHEGLSSSL